MNEIEGWADLRAIDDRCLDHAALSEGEDIRCIRQPVRPLKPAPPIRHTAGEAKGGAGRRELVSRVRYAWQHHHLVELRGGQLLIELDRELAQDRVAIGGDPTGDVARRCIRGYRWPAGFRTAHARLGPSGEPGQERLRVEDDLDVKPIALDRHRHARGSGFLCASGDRHRRPACQQDERCESRPEPSRNAHMILALPTGIPVARRMRRHRSVLLSTGWQFEGE